MGLGSGIAMSCGVGGRYGSNSLLLWLWCRLAATGPNQPLAQELPHAEGAILKKQKKGVPVMAQWLANPTRNHEVGGSIPSLAQWIKYLMSP